MTLTWTVEASGSLWYVTDDMGRVICTDTSRRDAVLKALGCAAARNLKVQIVEGNNASKN